MRPARLMLDAVERQRDRFFLWSPICLASGIGAYFSLLFEPSGLFLGISSLAALVLLRMAWGVRTVGAVLALGLFIAVAGFGLAALRAHSVAETKLGWRYYGPIEGRIVHIDRSHSDAVRLTLENVRLSRLSPMRTPARVRVSMHGQQGFFTPEPGLTIMMTGSLSPPSGPVEPGGYDFRRQAWFQGLGAVGYTRTPILALEEPGLGSLSLRLYRLRMAISAHINERLPGRSGAFAAAILVGDRSGIDGPTRDALRASNLAHLLAISGLHMGLLTGVVYSAIRLGATAVPRIALRYPVRKWAAGAAIFTGAIYLALSGANVATERAFIMVAVMFGAVCLDRRAITLRSVALAALIVLALRPEALLGPGFQMSFAATTALVFAYGAMTSGNTKARKWPTWAKAVFGVAFSSFVAGAATAPIAAAHFNMVPHYGLVANVLTVPLMGAIIMPAAVGAALLAPFGLDGLALQAMDLPILWILKVAETVASWPMSVSAVVAPGPVVLPLISVGALILVLWQGRARAFGVVLMAGALGFWTRTERPAILVADTGGLIGVMTAEGRSLSKATGDGFSADTWIENDGERAEREVAAARSGFDVDGRIRRTSAANMTLIHATGKVAASQALKLCKNGEVLVVNVKLADAKDISGCNVYDIDRLSDVGSISIRAKGSTSVMQTASDLAGDRLWTR